MSSVINEKALLPGLPVGLRTPLFQCFTEITRNFREGRWEPSELNGGKLCEIVYCILKGHVDGSFPAKPHKPRNMVFACNDLANTPTTFPESVRILVPRMLLALYDVRNNRGVGHAGAEVNPNHMDSVAVLYMSKWVMAEIIRIFHGVDIDTATATVEALIDRALPVVWEVDGKMRVLKTSLSAREQTLVLLYHNMAAISDEVLLEWLEYSNATRFRTQILSKLHSERLIEYNAQMAKLSPTGIRYVEQNIDLELDT
jgi:hypothetical protein